MDQYSWVTSFNDEERSIILDEVLNIFGEPNDTFTRTTLQNILNQKVPGHTFTVTATADEIDDNVVRINHKDGSFILSRNLFI